MSDAHESLEDYLARVVRQLVERLVEDESYTGWDTQGRLDPVTASRYIWLAKIRMTAQVGKALDEYLRGLVVHGMGDRRERLLNEVLEDGGGVNRPTWKEIGEALGVSAQAAHRKYGKPGKRS